jgi:hypothetical protein
MQDIITIFKGGMVLVDFRDPKLKQLSGVVILMHSTCYLHKGVATPFMKSGSKQKTI